MDPTKILSRLLSEVKKDEVYGILTKEILKAVYGNFKETLFIRGYNDFIKNQKPGDLVKMEGEPMDFVETDLDEVIKTLITISEINEMNLLDSTCKYLEEMNVTLPNFEELAHSTELGNLEGLATMAINFNPFEGWKEPPSNRVRHDVHKLIAACGKQILRNKLREDAGFNEMVNKILTGMKNLVASDAWITYIITQKVPNLKPKWGIGSDE